jgi:hypothetical protein
MTQIMRARPGLPRRARIEPGVAKIPVPMTRLKMSIEALRTPIWRLFSAAT